MTVRDLGYRAYDGPRLPPSNAAWVMFRYGSARIGASWMVRLAVMTCWIPAVGLFVGALLSDAIAPQLPEQAEGLIPELFRFGADDARVLSLLLAIETWFFVSLITVGAGASAIADDLTHRAFQFYFAKPVTPASYLFGRTGALAVWILAVSFGSAVLFVLPLAALGPREDIGRALGLLVPALVFSMALAVVTSAASIATSAISKSRALTISTWLTLFIVPHAIASVVDAVARANGRQDGWPWFFLTSFTALLGIIRDALFKIESESALAWFHAVPALAAVVVLAIWGAHERLRRTEVIA
jgi:ABC-type transport system involved in multi-copper enzyme maturation permease subunit